MFAVVLDTCVLWPSLQRDFLLSLAAESLYRPLWSDRILEELEYHEALKLEGRGVDPRTAELRAHKLIQQMAAAFDDALVEHWQPHEGAFGLPDLDDEHVVAAAVVGGAGAIVTDNVKHFPKSQVPSSISILKPAQFAADTVSVSPEVALRAVETLAQRFRKPPVDVEDVLKDLEVRYGMHEAVDLIRGIA
ncbi:PIN domain-containing protein [Nocardia takedensis]